MEPANIKELLCKINWTLFFGFLHGAKNNQNDLLVFCTVQKTTITYISDLSLIFRILIYV